MAVFTSPTSSSPHRHGSVGYSHREDLAPSREDLAPSREDLAPSREDLAPSREDLALSRVGVQPLQSIGDRSTSCCSWAGAGPEDRDLSDGLVWGGSGVQSSVAHGVLPQPPIGLSRPQHAATAPGHQDHSPGHQDHSPGHQDHSPGHQDHSPGTPGPQPGTPGPQPRDTRQDHSPGTSYGPWLEEDQD
ncbi:unnamed protein product [Arctogadus glacialis]